jgi:hypothetical protein
VDEKGVSTWSRGTTLVLNRIFLRLEEKDNDGGSTEVVVQSDTAGTPATRIVEQNLHISMTEIVASPAMTASPLAASDPPPPSSAEISSRQAADCRGRAARRRRRPLVKRNSLLPESFQTRPGRDLAPSEGAAVWDRLGNPELLLCEASALLS